ncbi:MAG: hypothetical protein V3W41_20115 [Planctomycetota bacterium]
MSPHPLKKNSKGVIRPGSRLLFFVLLVLLIAWWLSQLLGPKTPESGEGSAELTVTKLALEGESPAVRHYLVSAPSFSPSELSQLAASGSRGDSGSGMRFLPRSESLETPEVISGNCALGGEIPRTGFQLSPCEVAVFAPFDDSAFPGFTRSGALDREHASEGEKFVLNLEAQVHGARFLVSSKDENPRVTAGIIAELRPWSRETIRSADLGLHDPLRGGRGLSIQVEMPQNFANGPGVGDGTLIRGYARPAMPTTPLGPAPYRGADKLQPSASTALFLVIADADNILLFPGLSRGSFDVLILAEGFRPVAQTLEGGQNVQIALQRSEASKFNSLTWPRAQEGAVLASLKKTHSGRVGSVPSFLIEPDRHGRLTLEFAESTNFQLLRPGFPVRAFISEANLTTLLTESAGQVRLPAESATSGHDPGLVLEAIEALGVSAEQMSTRRFVDEAFGRAFLRCDGQVLDFAPGLYAAVWRLPQGQRWQAEPFEVLPDKEVSLPLPDAYPPARCLEISLVSKISRLPVMGAALTLGQVDPSRGELPGRPVATSDDKGVIRLEGIPRSAMEWTILAPGHDPLRGQSEIESLEGKKLYLAMSPSPGRCEIRVEDQKGRPIGGLTAFLLDPNGHRYVASSSPDGRLQFSALSAGRYLLYGGRTVPPADDSVAWQFSGAAGPIISVPPALKAKPFVWRLPRQVKCRFQILFRNLDSGPVHLQLQHTESALAPGLWPKVDLGTQTSGILEVDGLFPGTYHALAVAGKKAAFLRIIVPAGPLQTIDLDFDFKPKLKR